MNISLVSSVMLMLYSFNVFSLVSAANDPGSMTSNPGQFWMCNVVIVRFVGSQSDDGSTWFGNVILLKVRLNWDFRHFCN